MSDDGEREKGTSAEEPPASFTLDESGEHTQRSEETHDGEGHRRRLLICACAGSMAALALVCGCIWFATSTQPNGGSDPNAPTIAASDEAEETDEGEGSSASEKRDTGNEEAEGESDEVSADSASVDNDASNDTGSANTGSNSSGNSSSSDSGSNTSSPTTTPQGSTNSGSSQNSSSSSGSNTSTPSKPQHTHDWVPVTTTVHHDAVYDTVHHDAVTERRSICNGCGLDVTGFESAHIKDNILNGCGGCHDEWRTIQEAWDEQVLVSAAWDETVITGYKCSCGATK